MSNLLIYITKAMLKNLKYTILFLFLAQVIIAQPSAKDFIKKGNEAMSYKNYSSAMVYYTQAYDLDNESTELLYNLIQSQLNAYAYSPAEDNLHYLLDTLKSTEFPDAYYSLAELKLTTGQYVDAQRYYELYLSEYDDSPLSKRAKLGLESAEWALENPDSIAGNEIETLPFNSGYSEHAPVVIEEELYFSALKYEYKNDDRKPKRYLSKIISEKTIGEVTPMADNFNGDDALTSNAAVSLDGMTMIFNLCQYVNNADINCELYIRKKDENGEWKSSTKLPSPINVAGSTSTHPSFGKNDDGKQVLYFVSNRLGGKGGNDIWETSYDTSMNFTTPINVSSVNTEMDDITPFYNSMSETLYFSTNGRKGYGGYDIFQSKNGKIENLGQPTNSSYHDIFYVSYNNEEKNYLSSNRKGSKYLDSKFETCCFDIYKLNKEAQEMELLALIYDEKTKQPIIGATVELIDGCKKNLDANISTNAEGNDFLYTVNPNCTYTLKVSREGYEDALVEVTGEELKEFLEEGKMEKEIFLTPKKVMISVQVFEKPTNKDLKGATVVILDMTDGGKEVYRNTNPDGNNFDFEGNPCHDYKMIVTRDGYETHTETFSVPCDAEEKISKKVYLGRRAVIETLSSMLPIRLYFDNDLPDKSTMNVTTDKLYTETYNNYYPRKGYFESVYRNPLAIGDFFETEVKSNYESLTVFMETLSRMLKSGKKVNLYLRGYASPISVNEYNKALGKRRVDCVRNEFKRYGNGMFQNYIDIGQLIITERSFGEKTAAEFISDDPATPIQSIFSPEASKERRVEIDEILEVKN